MNDVTGDFDRLLAEMRPKLHRYCARMTGSAVDGEDVVQEAMIKALTALATVDSIENPEGWLFRIAHNAALDFLRRRARGPVMQPEEDLTMIAAFDAVEQDHEIATASMRTFLRLPALQRSAVILKDVLGHSIEEVGSITGATEAAAKSALQRGRSRLRELAREPEDAALPMLSDAMRERLIAYVDGFKTGDFDAVRRMLAEEVRLDLVGRLTATGKSQVGEYYGRYAATDRWAYAAAVIDGRPSMLVFDRALDKNVPAYFVTLDWKDGRVVAIRDFLFARYVMEGAEILAVRR